MHHSLQAERRKPPQQGYASNLLGEQPAWRGIMWADGSNVRIQKGFMSWDAFDRALDEVTSKLDVAATPMALHFRIATHGAVKPGCCHPSP